MTLTLEVDLPADLVRFQLPDAVAARLQTLLDRQESGQPLTTQERDEAEGLVSHCRHQFLEVGARSERSQPVVRSQSINRSGVLEEPADVSLA